MLAVWVALGLVQPWGRRLPLRRLVGGLATCALLFGLATWRCHRR